MNVIMNLTIKRRWFDMIASSEKREEYRSEDNRNVVSAYKRLSNYERPFVSCMMILRNGYRMDSRALAIILSDMTIRSGAQARHPEWGEPTDRGAHFVIMLDRIIARGTYAEIKEAFDKPRKKRNAKQLSLFDM